MSLFSNLTNWFTCNVQFFMFWNIMKDTCKGNKGDFNITWFIMWFMIQNMVMINMIFQLSIKAYHVHVEVNTWNSEVLTRIPVWRMGNINNWGSISGNTSIGCKWPLWGSPPLQFGKGQLWDGTNGVTNLCPPSPSLSPLKCSLWFFIGMNWTKNVWQLSGLPFPGPPI